MKTFKELATENLFEASDFTKNMAEINKAIDKAIEKRDWKALDALSKDLDKILRDLELTKRTLKS